MESQLFSYGKVINFRNIKVSTKLWKAIVVLPLCPKSITLNKLSIKSMWLIRCILN